MPRFVILGLVVWFVIAAPARPAEPTRPVPFYALPPDGTWVEYEWKAVRPDGEAYKGTLLISSVGRKEVDGVACRWVELRKEYKVQGEARKEYRKLLVAEKAFAEGGVLLEQVRRGLARDGADGPVVPLSAGRLRRVVGMGFDGPGATFKELPAEKVKTPLGQFAARRVTASVPAGERTREYHGWLIAAVPFGWAKFEVRERRGQGPARLVFTAIAAQAGKGATGEVDESRAR